MPTVQIDMFEGRTIEQKRMLVEKVTKAIVESIDTKPENVKIVIRDMPRENSATAGILAIDKK
jgi:4-oxalocrotonate tautomerase